jgi:hypothetical protein
MATKKTTPKKKKSTPKVSKKAVSKKTNKPAPAKTVAKSNKSSMKKAAPKKTVSKKADSKKPIQKAAVKTTAPQAAVRNLSRARPSREAGRRGRVTAAEALPMKKGPGTSSAGQSGDIQGLPDQESVDTESVEELAEEGQGFEAAFVNGVENAPDPDEAEVTTSEEPEDDVPSEYLENE